MWLKGLGGGEDDIGADGQGLIRVDADRQGVVLVVGFFDHSRNPHKIDLVREAETAGDWRTGEDQDVG